MLKCFLSEFDRFVESCIYSRIIYDTDNSEVKRSCRFMNRIGTNGFEIECSQDNCPRLNQAVKAPDFDSGRSEIARVRIPPSQPSNPST